MLTQPIFTPTSLAQVDEIAENLRAAMKDTFSFEIGPKKQQRLREVTCRTLGFRNGLQQAMAGFPEDLSKTEAYPDSLPDVLIFECSALDEVYLYLDASDMTPLKSGDIKELSDPGFHPTSVLFDESNESDLKDQFGMSFTAMDRALMGHYCCERIFITTPRIDRYGVPELGVPHYAKEQVRDLFGFECIETIEEDHYIQDSGDDSAMVVYLKLVKKPKVN